MAEFSDKFIVLSDLHLLPAGQTIIGIDPFDRAAQALNHAIATHPDASRIVLLGDLTHNGTAEEYARLSGALQDIPLPVHLMVGNHDRRDAFRAAFPDAPDAEGFVCDTVALNGATLVMLDTLDGPPYQPKHHAGLLCDTRMAWLDHQLRQHDRVILALHHPPAAVGFPGMDAIALSNGAEMLDLIQQHGNVAHMICGHIHRTISGQMRGVPFTIFKSPCDQMPMDMVSTTSSLSVPEPGAYGIVCLRDDGVIVHSEDFTLTCDPIHRVHSPQ